MKILLLLMPIFACAAEVSFENSDFVMRSVNFVIFVALLWWLVAKHIKNALKARQDEISAQLNAVQVKLAESNNKKLEKLKELENAKKLAIDIVANAHKEAEVITKNIQNQCKKDLEILQKSYIERMGFEQKRAKKSIVSEVLSEILRDENIALDKKKFVEIITKKVA
ncbi:F0F1 ATP synthase subunit B [Helicobacter sp. 23-1044]